MDHCELFPGYRLIVARGPYSKSWGVAIDGIKRGKRVRRAIRTQKANLGAALQAAMPVLKEWASEHG